MSHITGFVLSDDARNDLDAIADYIAAESSVEQALKVLAKIRAELRKLSESPGIGHFRTDLLDKRFKFWRVYSYVIAYRWEADPIQIIAVVHGARDLESFLNRREP